MNKELFENLFLNVPDHESTYELSKKFWETGDTESYSSCCAFLALRVTTGIDNENDLRRGLYVPE